MIIIEYLAIGAPLLIVIILYLKDRKRPLVKSDNYREQCESPIETRLYDALKFNGYNVTTQVKVGRYRIDIAIPSHKIAIECDGKAYHTAPGDKARDRKKDEFLRRNGWRVIRFSGRRIYRDMRGIITRIDKELGKIT
jgi:very-short-patch-repair endonuclease